MLKCLLKESARSIRPPRSVVIGLTIGLLALSVSTHAGDIAFGPGQGFPGTGNPSTSFVRDVLFADIDGDGAPDIVASSNDNLTWSRNTGLGFPPPSFDDVFHIDLTPPGEVYHLATLDVDPNANPLTPGLDIVVAGDSALGWYKNLDGAGTFGPANELTLPGGPAAVTAVAALDIDDDGFTDLVAGGTTGLFYYVNDQAGGFLGPVVHSPFLQTLDDRFSTADMDGDGDLDLIMSGLDSARVVLVEPFATVPGFTPLASVSLGASAGFKSHHTVDMDSDGDLDVLAPDTTGITRVVWFPNDGTGNLGAALVVGTPIGAPGNVRGLIGMDMDGDGDTDVLATAPGGLTRFENLDGLGTTFGAPVALSGVVHPWALDVVDADNDLDFDIAYGFTGIPNGAGYIENQLETTTAVFANVGKSLLGGNGDPLLATRVCLNTSPFPTLELNVYRGLPNAQAYLLLGFSEGCNPSQGGIVVPDMIGPSIIFPVSMLDSNGRKKLPIPLDPVTIPPGVDLWLQYWLADSGPVTPFNFSATNGVMGTTP